MMNEITGTSHYSFLIEVTSKKIKGRLQQRFNEEKIGLTVDQWVILDHLKQNDGINQMTLANRISKDAPTVTRIVDLLCNKGMIERRNDPVDRRRFNLFLCNKGHNILNRAQSIVLESHRLGWTDLSKSDYQHLLKILTTINRNFGNHNFFANNLDKIN
ncbi:MAG: MarR family winged helix-turn-helix transcriptional regulator [Bacteroidetes bacterium]|nr:MarR family winged helix-turn-helix transcriptional regulator [Bacteroidota bacterium]